MAGAATEVRLEGRSALITGGTGALGRAVVQRVLEEGASVHVPVYAEEEVDALASFLGDAVAAVHLHRDADLTDPDVVSRVVAGVREREGRGPDILLNLAGGFFMAGIEETGPEQWERMWRMNASTAFLCSRAVFLGMKEAGWGRIVNVSAHPAVERGEAGLSAYGAGKAAVLNLTETLAREGVEHGVTVNAILPSIIDTPANRSAMPEADTSSWLPPHEIAGVIAYLVSDAARIVTGARITLSLG